MMTEIITKISKISTKNKEVFMKIITRILAFSMCAAMLFAMVLGTVGCSSAINAENLLEGITPSSVNGKQADEGFISSSADFAIKLFRQSVAGDKNSLISPLSVMLALAMTANGADGKTLQEMETVLGGGMSVDELNEYLYTYMKTLPSTDKAKVTLANSIWFRNEKGFVVENDFLQRNADYYNAPAYKAEFDSSTVDDINRWVSNNTDGMIDRIIDGDIDEDTMMYLINALVFDAEWAEIYEKRDIRDGIFTCYDGSENTVSMMSSSESLYIECGNAKGFIKQYAGGEYCFAALLPNEGVDILDYIDSLTGEGFVNAYNNAEYAEINAKLPKFSYDYSLSMNDALIAMGMPSAFLKADFSKMSNEDLFISQVLHKTFISVDERGTRAGAVTSVQMNKESCPDGIIEITLDRPFVYAIVDNATGLPIFIGAVLGLGK